MTYAHKVDENHGTIRDGLRDTFGDKPIQDVSMYRGLGFDLIAVGQDGAPRFLEIKPPKKITRLTKSELAARARYGPYWRVVTTLEEALEALQEAPAA